MIPRSLALFFLYLSITSAQNHNGGEEGYRKFEVACALCHGSDGTGGEFGPNISVRLQKLSDSEIQNVIHGGLVKSGMPAFPNLTDTQISQVISFLRTLKPRPSQIVRRKVITKNGEALEGVVLNQGPSDLALQTSDTKIHLLRKENDAFRQVTSQVNWSSYNGDQAGNRLVSLSQIKKANVSNLATRWMFTVPDASNLETTPLVVDGIMYVTSANQCYALDAGNGRTLWHFQRPRNKELFGGGIGINRGAAVSGNGLFLLTDDAHILRLNRLTGLQEWDTVMADWRQNYFASSAPLVVGDLVVSGTAGGEHGARGFIAAYDQRTGREVWRFWTVPATGEPGSESWQGVAPMHGGAVAWFTGSYDQSSDTLYWQTGNPGPDYNGEQRRGDNLYSDCVLALDAKTGTLKWHYQFTPHDTHDWDATEPVILADSEWQGKPRKLLFTANRNGFFYVLDRTDGSLLLARPFVHKLNWASQIGTDGRPVLSAPEALEGGTKVCPSQDGATNWYSASYLPSTGLLYLQTLEKCDIYSQSPAEWKSGEAFLGGSQRPVPGEVAQKFLRAIDTHSGKVTWELPEAGRAISWGGTLATQNGLVFFAEDSGSFMAVDAETGKFLWSFEANQIWKASPMAYQFDGQEYVAIASGETIVAFALPR